MMYSPFFSSLPLPFYLMILNDIKHISNQNSEGEDEIVNRSNTRVCLTLYSISYHLHHSNLGSFQLNPSQLIVCLVFFLAGDCSVYLFPLLPVLVYFWRSSHPYAVVPMDPNTAVWKAVVATLTAGWIAKKKRVIRDSFEQFSIFDCKNTTATVCAWFIRTVVTMEKTSLALASGQIEERSFLYFLLNALINLHVHVKTTSSLTVPKAVRFWMMWS